MHIVGGKGVDDAPARRSLRRFNAIQKMGIRGERGELSRGVNMHKREVDRTDIREDRTNGPRTHTQKKVFPSSIFNERHNKACLSTDATPKASSRVC